MKSRPILALAAAALTSIPFPLMTHAAVVRGNIRTVAVSGLAAPGTDEFFGDVGYSGVSLNNLGQTVFIASRSFNEFEFVFEPDPVGSLDDESVWTEAGGSGLRRIAQEGSGQPGDGTFTHVARPLISDMGETHFHGSFAGQRFATQHFASSIVLNRPEQFRELIAAQGLTAPSTTANFYDVWPPSINALGGVVFSGTLATGDGANPTNNRGVWLELDNGTLGLIARRGDGAPGTDATFHDFSQGPVIGSGGHAAFLATLAGPDISELNDEGVWLANPTGGLTLAVRESEIAPGTNLSFRLMDRPTINEEGDITFTTWIPSAPPGGNPRGKVVVRYSRQQGPILVASQGEAAPGTNAVFGSNHINFATFSNPVIGDAGHIAFNAQLLSAGQMAASVWVADPAGVLKLVAREGDAAPGSTDSFTSVGDPTVNARGQVAFSGRTIDFTNQHYGIWAQDQHGILQAVVLAGDILNVSDDPVVPDLRTVEFLSFREGGSFGTERVTGFNDLGQVAFFARFTDGSSGVFVSNVVAVPEPSTLAVLIALSLACRLLDVASERAPGAL